jgi:hypothetical protein
MLRKLGLHHVGPAEHLVLDPVAKRLNLITGDNGLGKSFLLEAAWWALTRTWHEPAIPSAPNAKIEHHFDGAKSVSKGPTTWDPRGQQWKRALGRPANPGLVLYARVDGSFSVWDPARNYRLYHRQDGGRAESPSAYQFSPGEVLFGLRRPATLAGDTREETLCLGLIDEWREWQRAKDPRFEMLERLLALLGPDDQPLTPGKPVRPTLDDVRVIPTVRMPYAQDVPITYAPAGVKRMANLAYLLTWAISCHLDEVSRRVEEGTEFHASQQVIVLIDEPETHLHPRWQRTVLPSLIRAVSRGFGTWAPKVQFLVATHSPLVLASVESLFDRTQDALWKLDLEPAANGAPGRVVIQKEEQEYRRGEASAWLRSDVFDHTSPYSKEAQDAIDRAMALLRSGKPSIGEVRAVTDALRGALSETDRMWVRWGGFAREHGVET